QEPPVRKKYRAGRRIRAVKVYTVHQESRYLLIERVPALGNTKELLEICSLYGSIEEYRLLDDYPSEEFYDVYWIKYGSLLDARYLVVLSLLIRNEKLIQAYPRMAKRKLDDYVFFGSPLQIRYCPEYETVEDTREKLIDRRRVVSLKTNTPDPLFDGAIAEKALYPEADTVATVEATNPEMLIKPVPKVDHITQSILNIREKLKEASRPVQPLKPASGEPKKRRRI
ncbi:hypothetical protein K493DRAFT_23917, partial [Basidiobolus meristosporus CBS 931.73]